jgi:lysozyme
MNHSRFNKLIVMLKRHEGVKKHVYTCSAGYETIGAGRNISPSGLGLSESEIHMLLTNDIYRVVGELSEEYKWFDDLDTVRKDAMIDLSFNLGQTSLRKFENALEAMKFKNYDKAASDFMDSKWSQQVGSRAVEITNMIRTGEYQ